ncbi:MAG: type IV pilus assembly protein PilM [Candidatus Pacebacteria bacterium]|nr:type IV pilus assembly protein PilM [Candidatus Paceibacterota bacterium]
MENPFKKIFQGMLKPSNPSVLGIDIGSSSIKVVQLKKKGGKAVLETYGELALGPYSGLEMGRATNLPTERVSEALKDLLREAKTSTKQCGVAIPIGSSMVTMIELPKVPEKELAQMIPLEARKYIPVPISEVSLDWWVIPEEPAETSEESEAVQPSAPVLGKVEKVQVLSVAIHNEVISRYQDIIAKSGIEASFIEIEIFSTIRALIDKSPGAIMIIDLGAGSTKLYIVDRGIVRNSHTINRGSQDITIALSSSLGVSIPEAENIKRSFGAVQRTDEKAIADTISLTTDFIFSESNRVLQNYQKKYNKNIAKVVLAGGGLGYKGLLELAKHAFEVEVMLGEPFSKVEFPAFLEPTLRMTGSEFSVAIGVALRRLQELP